MGVEGRGKKRKDDEEVGQCDSTSPGEKEVTTQTPT